MAEEFSVKGLSDLKKFLDELPVKLEKNVMRGAMRAAAKTVLPVAKAKIHNVSGELADGLKISTSARGGRIKATIKPTGKHAFLALFLEYGVKAHFISVQDSEKPINRRLSAKRGQIVLASMRTINRMVLKIGAKFVGPTVHHPGFEPKPFLRPALDANAQDAVIAAGNYVKERLATKQGLDTADITIEADSES